jgi:hypothetical protein
MPGAASFCGVSCGEAIAASNVLNLTRPARGDKGWSGKFDEGGVTFAAWLASAVGCLLFGTPLSRLFAGVRREKRGFDVPGEFCTTRVTSNSSCVTRAADYAARVTRVLPPSERVRP